MKVNKKLRDVCRLRRALARAWRWPCPCPTRRASLRLAARSSAPFSPPPPPTFSRPRRAGPRNPVSTARSCLQASQERMVRNYLSNSALFLYTYYYGYYALGPLVENSKNAYGIAIPNDPLLPPPIPISWL
jgi:hypothetical protein